jgi:S-DNA-T family DNA segregation ATPase FtsK/SpoIIIE
MGKKPKSKKSQSFDPVLSKGILAVILVIMAIIITLSFFEKAGAVGKMLNDYILSFLFGSIRFTTPVILLILAWFLIIDKEYNYRKTHGIGSFMFFIAMSSLMHIGFETSEMWSMSLNRHGGGIFGMLAWPMRQYLGTIAGSVLLVGMVIVSIFLIFNTAITHFIFINKKIFAGLGTLGKMILNTFGLFIKEEDKKQIKFKTLNNEDEDEEEIIEEDEEIEDEEEIEIKNKKFITKKLKNQEEDEEIEDEEKENKNKTSTWEKKVVIKNLPKLELLTSKKTRPTSGDIQANAQIIHDTLSEFNIEVDMGEVRVGPTVTQYSFKPAKGIKLSRITGLSNDLALALAAHPIRIEAPIPGKSLVGIEVPNEKVAMVTLKELLESKEFAERPHNMMIALGKDVAGKVWFADLPKMPHLLVAGTTGSGKTVCINTIIMSLLYQNTAETLRLIMVDPKRVELTLYNGIPHLLTPVITNVQKTVNALKWCIGEMDRRFEVFSQVGCRDITSYNKKHPNEKMPHIVFIIDELADLMATAAGEVEAGIIRIAQMARAVGIHLIVATQRPSVDVITGLMKANIPGRIAFSVASVIDSRTILDCPGAEKLLGRGDMLLLTAELSKPKRIQDAFVSEEEVKNVSEYLKEGANVEYDESIVEKPTNNGTLNMFGGASDDQDPLFMEAKETILEAGKASASFLQRRLKIGYARAARILDELETAGIIGPGEGAKPREILVQAEPENMGAEAEFNVYNDEDSVDNNLDEDNLNNEENDDEIEDDQEEENEIEKNLQDEWEEDD